MFMMMLVLMNQMNQNRSNSNSSATTSQESAWREAELAAQSAERKAQSDRDKSINRVLQQLRGADNPTLTFDEFVLWLHETNLTPKQFNLVFGILTAGTGTFREDYFEQEVGDCDRGLYSALVRYILTAEQCRYIWERIRAQLDYFEMEGVACDLIQQPCFRQSSQLRNDLLNELLKQHRDDEMFFDDRWDMIVNDICEDEALDVNLRQQLRHEHSEARTHGY